MVLWIFSPRERRYRALRRKLTESARRKLQNAGLDGEQVLTDILRRGLSVGQTGLRPRPTGTGIRIFTPRQLADVVRLLLEQDVEIASYLVMAVLPKTLPTHISASDFGPMVTYTLAPEFQGDVLMALEKTRALLPEEVERGAEVLGLLDDRDAAAREADVGEVEGVAHPVRVAPVERFEERLDRSARIFLGHRFLIGTRLPGSAGPPRHDPAHPSGQAAANSGAWILLGRSLRSKTPTRRSRDRYSL